MEVSKRGSGAECVEPSLVEDSVVLVIIVEPLRNDDFGLSGVFQSAVEILEVKFAGNVLGLNHFVV